MKVSQKLLLEKAVSLHFEHFIMFRKHSSGVRTPNSGEMKKGCLDLTKKQAT